MMKAMRSIKALLPLFVILGVSVGKAGTSDRGGGDSCERRIQEIAQDLSSWIRKGGHEGLKLEQETAGEYATVMLTLIQKTRITCVAPGDAGHPILVNGKPKECINFVESGISRIVCDREKFSAAASLAEQDEQYRLIHHEYATLAGFERPNEDQSNYRLSNQITGFLKDTVVRRLAVKGRNPKREK